MPMLTVATMQQCRASKIQENTEEQQVWAGIIEIRPRATRPTPTMDSEHLSSSANIIRFGE
eukprot:2992358-Karenia_brevis.AAC.1